jgi:hypothetical protein
MSEKASRLVFGLTVEEKGGKHFVGVNGGFNIQNPSGA